MARKSSRGTQSISGSIAAQAADGIRAHGAGFSGGQTYSTIAPVDPMNFNNNPNAQQQDFTPRRYRSKSTKQG